VEEKRVDKMKYTGRLIMLVTVLLASVVSIGYRILNENSYWGNLYILPIWIGFSWWLGLKYDRAMLNLAELKNCKDELQQKYLDEINYMSSHDTLTGLPNRYMFNEYLQASLDHCKKNTLTLAVMFIDLDRFKIVNESMGHEVGDLLLKEVAQRLMQSIRKEDIVARQGGDEFIVLLENINLEQTKQIAQRMVLSFLTPFEIGGGEFFITPSIGISLYPDDGEDVNSLIKNADKAMYLVKKNGKNDYQFSSYESDEAVTRKIKLENSLRKAIQKNEFFLFYQPQVNLHTGEIKGLEALLRWNHPELGIVSPLEFIPIAEETGLIVPIGKWVLQTACNQNKEWQKAGLPSVCVAVNVSPRQLQDARFINIVKGVLQETKLDPHYLELEITESLMQNLKHSLSMLSSLKELGVSLSIDDFGTGFSSLNVLKSLPIDCIKIDQSFVRDISIDSNTAAIVKTIIHMGKNLNFQLIAEGIEEKEQVSFLVENGCQLGQGYAYSRPVSAEEIEKVLKQSSILEPVH
jgi:diguanylate cyclase (GGDEF)-like protein